MPVYLSAQPVLFLVVFVLTSLTSSLFACRFLHCQHDDLKPYLAKIRDQVCLCFCVFREEMIVLPRSRVRHSCQMYACRCWKLVPGDMLIVVLESIFKNVFLNLSELSVQELTGN